ncbi:hypothetical protein EBX93_13410, partial [bacterium]|nr:hypothetical protein [bacterium]
RKGFLIPPSFKKRINPMTVRCVVIKNHKNRGAQYRAKYNLSPHLVKLRCTQWQVTIGEHHLWAIDLVKNHLEEQGLDPKDFDYVSFDYLEGYFINHLFTKPEILELWLEAKTLDIRHYGPFSPFGPNSEYPDGNKELTSDDVLDKYLLNEINKMKK